MTRLGQKYKGVDWLLAAILAPLVSFSLISYFIDPRTLLHTVWALKINGVLGLFLLLTAVLFLLVGILRFRFCSNACPYGFLQMVFKDAPAKEKKRSGPGTWLPLLLLFINGVFLVYLVVSHPGYHVRINQTTKIQNPETYLFVGNVEIENLENASHHYSLSVTGTSPGQKILLPEKVLVEAENVKRVPLVITGKKSLIRRLRYMLKAIMEKS
ncbi:hypothetical protein skT53_09360 [Effusibacillus dendaii]|uniref:4Fe-4S ferredoxin-type domain-containing protein n=1 Tax=Effusibacillus dendaii TaxID=2743772 RepID=A0A7I8DDI6_9BACL|nr:hypothetical protein skT53_09360 [Effusibacillus dendaii]